MLPTRRIRMPLFEAPGGPGGGGSPPAPAPPTDPQDAPAYQGPWDASYVTGLREEAKRHRLAGKAAREAITVVGEMLGLAPEHLNDPARVKAAATSLRTTAAVDDAIARHGVDRRLTRALLESERALAPLDEITPAEYPAELDRIITELLQQNPALKAGAATGPTRSGLPITGQGASQPQRISPRELRQMNLPPERVAELHRQGLIDTGGER